MYIMCIMNIYIFYKGLIKHFKILKSLALSTKKILQTVLYNDFLVYWFDSQNHYTNFQIFP